AISAGTTRTGERPPPQAVRLRTAAFGKTTASFSVQRFRAADAELFRTCPTQTGQYGRDTRSAARMPARCGRASFGIGGDDLRRTAVRRSRTHRSEWETRR